MFNLDLNINDSNYERLITALKGLGEPDRVPLLELGIAPSIKKKLLNIKEITLEDEIRFALKFGYDYVKLQPIVNFKIKTLSSIGHSDVSLSNENINWVDEHSNVIKNFEDFEKFPFPEKRDIDYSRFEKIAKILPDNLAVIGQYGDIFTMVWQLMGFENFSYALFDNPDLIEVLFNKIGEIVYSMFENMITFDIVKVLWYSDDIAYSNGLMVDPETLRKYFFPWLKKIGKLAQKYNKPFIYHSDGKLLEVMEDILNSGVDALHPIEPKAMNIYELKKSFGNRLTLAGNIDLIYTLTRGTIEDVENEVKEKIHKLAPGGRYCLSSANSIPDYVKIENFIVMVKNTIKYGKYPIQ